MSKGNRENLPRVNFFDGQRVTETDLDIEQIHHRSIASNIIVDFHKSGVVKDRIFDSRILLDTSAPGNYSEGDSENISRENIESGLFDGLPINVDRQPEDITYGNRLEISSEGLNIGGRTKAKVLILGLKFSSIKTGGELCFEIVEFEKNQTKLTRNYYTKIISVFFNNFSGGTGKTEFSVSATSLNTAGKSGKIVIKEAEPLKAFARTAMFEQIESPNIGLSNFITSSQTMSIEDEIRKALGTSYNFEELYFELSSSKDFLFKPYADQTISYGQKFLAKTNNIQKVDLLLYVERDDDAAPGSKFDFSGEIVFSIHKLREDISCITDPNPNNLIDFDPDPSPIAEVSYSQEDLESMGIRLGKDPTVVSIDFSSTLIADPNIDPIIKVDSYYAFMVTRRGGNSSGTIGIPAGYYKPARKNSNGQDLDPEERFGRQHYRLVEFDPQNSIYVDYHDLSMWCVVHSDSIEVTAGSAYSTDGMPISLPKVVDYVGSTKIPLFTKDIALKNVASGDKNFLALYREDKFTSPATHPRTGNFVNTRIEDAASLAILSEAELDESLEDGPLLLGRIIDNNTRDAEMISGESNLPGEYEKNYITIINPPSKLLSENLIGRVFVPDNDCSCNSRYRIVSTECSIAILGDLNDDSQYDNEDINLLLDLVGNTIGTPTTDRKILGGEISLVDFVKADLNDDKTIDGDDIEILENAVDGYVNFSAEQEVSVLRIFLENILEENDFPTIFSTEDFATTSLSGETAATSSEVSFLVETEEDGLAIRAGDTVRISSASVDSGDYIIVQKTFDPNNLSVTLSVSDYSGGEVEFSGSSGFDIVIVSETPVNIFADNKQLLSVPFEKKNWSIIFFGANHSESQIDVCDLRRFVETNLLEEKTSHCLCEAPACIQPEVCGPYLKNQKVLSDDLYIPNGEIYQAPGVPYHGDIEFANISIPLPPGSIDDCQIDLYTNFIKSYAGTCKTASGYPAMRFSDGTYVGCEDDGGETDITKGRVKISQSIASLHVDAFVDGYAVDGYADESEASTSNEIIRESFVDYTYPSSSGFSDWPILDPSGGTYFTITTSSAINSTADFMLETITSAKRTGGIQYPHSLVPDLSGDFVLDFTASRTAWPGDSLSAGNVKFFSELVIVNDDGTTCTLKMGWRVSFGSKTELFYSGEIKDSSTGSIISDFDRSIEAKDDLGDSVNFRFRRTGEAVFGMYFDKTMVDENSIDGKFIKIGGTPSLVPGSGDAKTNFYMEQAANPNAGVIFSGKVFDVNIRYNLDSEDQTDLDTVLVSRDSSTAEITRINLGFPILLSQRTNIVSAYMELTTADAYVGSDSFNIIPLEVLNADNLGKIIDYPITENNSIISSFTPGPLAQGETIQVDITPMAVYFLSRTGHLPGFSKAVILEPSSDANSELRLQNNISFVIEYEDLNSGVIFKVGASIDASTGIVSFNTKNILYDSANPANRTILSFGVYLKKSGFRNNDIVIGISDLDKLGIGTCKDEAVILEDDLCFFIAGDTATGTFVQGPFPCYFHLP